MAVPASVKKQAEEAARMMGELNDSAAQEATPSAGEQPEHQAQAPQHEETRDAAYWQQRFNVVDGKYRAEIPRLQGKVTELTEQVNTLTQQLEQAKQAKPTEQKASDYDANFLTPEEVEEYGDLAEVISRVAQRVADARTQPVAERINQFDTEFKQTKQQTAEQRFYAELDKEVDGWRETDKDPAFHAFLAEVEAYSGRTRQELLVDAYRQGDVQRVARFFLDFRGDHTKPAQARPNPASKVQPDSRGASSTPASGRTWTTAQINEFYKQKSMGKFVGKEAEARAIESDIIAASKDGRLIG